MHRRPKRLPPRPPNFIGIAMIFADGFSSWVLDWAPPESVIRSGRPVVGRRASPHRFKLSVQWETAIRFGCTAARFGITTSSTPCLPLAEMASASAVSGRVNRR